MIVNRNPRSYEVSIWTLQDSFITVLKSPYLEHKGQIENPELSLKDDSEDTFSFRIPMYIQRNGKRIENPGWYNTRNGNLIADMRKLKVIFNKEEENEQVFEFLVTKVTEKHEGFETWCEVESEGLAFHELGKTGYNIELSGDLFFIEYNDWLDEDGDLETEPVNNINYWIDKVLDNTLWDYEICMDWNGYSNRESEKVYEDAYVSDWNINSDILTPGEIIYETEKLRLVEGQDSNRFNLLQTIAETFGVYCKFQYEYDENYHIIGRTVVFYNNFFQEDEEGVFDLNYHYDTDDISREMDSTELITKMIVLNQDGEDVENSMMTTDANLLLENYLLNFDYLYSIGAINEEQYQEIKKYNVVIHDLNVRCNRLDNRIISYQNILLHAQAMAETARQSLILDQEGMQEETAYINYLLDKSGGDVEAKVLYVTKDTAKPQYPLGDERYVKPYDKYAMNVLVFSDSDCTQLVENVVFERDEEGFCTRVVNIPEDIPKVYLTYEYSPDLHHKLIYEQWVKKFAADSKILAQYQPIVDKLDGLRDNATGELINDDEPGLIQECNDLKEELLEEKNLIMIKFENMMGPALREGTWQPEDSYSKYGSHQNVILSFEHPSQKDATLIWDDKLFEEEETNYYEEGVELEKIYYPCINVKECLESLKDYVGNEIIVEEDEENDISITKQFGLIINDKIKRYVTKTIENSDEVERVETVIDNYKIFPVKYGFIKNNYWTIPILIITNIQEYYDAMNINEDMGLQEYIRSLDGKIGYLITTTTKDSNGMVSITQEVEATPLIDYITIIPDIEEYITVYPRIKFDTYNLKTSSDELKIKYKDNSLQVNEDYYILTKYKNASDGSDIEWENITAEDDNEDYDYNYYITMRPEVLFRDGLEEDFYINYTLNNTGLMVYLDAIQILKENSVPKVSYTITPKVVKRDFIKNLYSYMHCLVHINDYELKFNNVMGYISGIDLKLDTPWEDSIEIKNYKTKFEDLFSSIVASTEAMKKNSATISAAASAFTSTGNLSQKILQNSISFADLNYAFNNGRLTINEKDGIWAVNENGVVAINGGGIFTATEKDSNGNWVWNTGLLPRGISANAITAGQLDTNLIRVYAGDNLRFQLNGDGLFAYKSWLNEDNASNTDIAQYGGIDPAQYVVHNAEGLFLVAKTGAKMWNNVLESWTVLEKDINRVAITWDGLTLRNYNDEKVFFADADTGDLKITGDITATSLTLKGDNSGINVYGNGGYFKVDSTHLGFYTSPTDGNEEGEPLLFYENGDMYITGNIYASSTIVNSGSLNEPGTSLSFEEYTKQQAAQQATTILNNALSSSIGEEGSIQVAITERLNAITGNYQGTLASLASTIPSITSASSEPSNYKTGDIFYNTSNGIQYIYDGSEWIPVSYVLTSGVGTLIERPQTANIGSTYQATDGDRYIYTSSGWQSLDSAKRITGAALDIDAAAGTINLNAQNDITLLSNGSINLNGKQISLLANDVANNEASISLITTTTLNDETITNNVFTLNKDGITMFTNSMFKAIGNAVVIATNGSETQPLDNYIWMHTPTGENPRLDIKTAGNMEIASGGNMTIASGGNMTIGASSGVDATLSLLSTGKLTAYGAKEVVIATGDESNKGSYLWMHENNNQKVLDIGTTGNFKILSEGKFSAIAADEVLIASLYDKNTNTIITNTSIKPDSSNVEGSYLWMHTKNNRQVLDIGTTGDFQILSGGNFSAVAASNVLIASAVNSNNEPTGNYIWMHSVNEGTTANPIWKNKLDISTTGKMAVNADSLVIKIPTGEDENQNDTIIEYDLDDYISDLGPSESINRWFNFGDNGLTISATIGENENGDVIKSPWSTVIYEEGYKVCYEDQAVFNVQRDKSTLNAIKMGNIVIKKSQKKGMVWVKE